MAVMYDWRYDGKDQAKHPNSDNGGSKIPVRKLFLQNNDRERLRGYAKRENSTRHISDLYKPPLGRAYIRRRKDRIFVEPVKREDERQGLLEVGNKKVQN
jgi:hypothetical protein